MRTFGRTSLLAIAALVAGCGDDVADAASGDVAVDGGGVADGAAADADAGGDAAIDDVTSDVGIDTGEPIEWPPPTRTYDFIVTAFGFDVPEGLAEAGERIENPCGLDLSTNNTRYTPLVLDGLVVDGFDLDGEDGQGDGPCAHTDYAGPDGAPGVDYGFLHVMDMIRPARPGQTIETVLASAPSQGLIRIGIRLTDVDDLENDDDVRLIVTNLTETPLLGADGRPLAGGSVPALDEPEFQSELPGAIVDGTLFAGPADLVMGHINLLVIEDRVVALRDARIRATVTERASGGLEVDGLVHGWWERESMIEAIGYAVTTIGANPGELECVLDAYADHSLDGETCNAMSTILRVRAVSGFITGLDDTTGGE